MASPELAPGSQDDQRDQARANKSGEPVGSPKDVVIPGDPWHTETENGRSPYIPGS